jgi:GAF domain-containing protein
MSAPAQQHYYSPIPQFQELDTARAISREAARATLPALGLAAVAQRVLRIDGACAVHVCGTANFHAARELGLRDLTLASHGTHTGTRASAIAPISAGGSVWGELRIEFDIPSFAVESPVRFAIYVAQQIANMLQRIHLLEQAGVLEDAVGRLRRAMATRKTVHRAAGILARAYQLTEQAAIALLIQQSRDSSCPVRGIAEQIISSHRVVPGVSARR